MMQRTTLVGQIHQVLEEEILTGILPNGARLDEQMLAARFSVSRTPAREALLQLASAGLVEVTPRQGATVTSVGLREYFSMVEILTELEGLAASLAARRMTTSEREALARAHKKCERASAQGVAGGYAIANMEFHELIYVGARNPPLHRQLAMMRVRLRHLRESRFNQPSRVKASVAEHAAVVEAIRQGDEQAARNAMRTHILTGGSAPAEVLAYS